MIYPISGYDTYGMQVGRKLFYLNKKLSVGKTYYEYKPVHYAYQTTVGLYLVMHDERIQIPSNFIRYGSYYIPFLNHKEDRAFRSSLPKWMLFTDISEDERKTKVLK
jgi:hypothetical protein